MNRTLLLAGGITLLAGGLAYAYLAQGKPAPPPNGPPPNEVCQNLVNPCNVELEGFQECDRYSNLCRCHNGTWICIEKNSTICDPSDPVLQTKCFIVNGVATCKRMSGNGPDECEWPIGIGCPCTGICENETIAYCAGGYCIRKAIVETVYKNCESYDSEEITQPDGSFEHWCLLWLEEPLAMQSITMGSLKYKWAAVLDNIKYAIDLYYQGSWTRVVEGDYWNLIGTEGDIPIQPKYFAPQGVAIIAVGVNSGVSNVHLKNWSLTINF